MEIIELDLSNVEFSLNDVKRGIQVPRYLTTELCYETGMHIGDGHLSICKRKDGTLHAAVFSGDYLNEYDFYESILIPLLAYLYHRRFSIHKSTKNTLQIKVASKAVATFKARTLKLVNGSKKGRIQIPDIIMDAGLEFQKQCIGGIFDTDFSLVFRHGKYPKITGEIPFENITLKNQILEILKNIDIKYNCCICKKFDERFIKKRYLTYKIDINGRENLNTWLKTVGFRSSKHLIKLELWKKFGFCKPFLSYNERKRLLMPQ
jgi:hypothetical protein